MDDNLNLGRTCSSHGRNDKYIRWFVRKLEGRDHFEDPSVAWKNNIKMNLKGMAFESVVLIHLLKRDCTSWS
jgi:hypothetical protein